MLTRSGGRILEWPLDRLASVLSLTGIRPNVITWSAMLLNLWAAILFAKGRFAAGGGIMALAGLCDLLDGRVARLQNRVSLFGGFLESILDRYADLILFLGLLVYYSHVNRFAEAMLAGASMAGAVMVSYAKARAESLVPPQEVGFWERPERQILLLLGSLTNRVHLVLWVLAIGPNLTVIHRILHTWKQTKNLAPEQVPIGQDPSNGSKPVDSRVPSPSPSRSADLANARPFLTRSVRRGG
jgi:CDP-diacylglycerol---glycerol-3-phosphate 3-phosphatidyltransferase